MMATALGGVLDVGCWRFQRRWIDQLRRSIQVGESLVGDESPESSPDLVVGGDKFFL